MAHCKVLMVGTEANLMQIYADYPDSSSETKVEMAFAYDYLRPISKNELLGKGIKKYDSEDYEFTKEDTELYNKIVQGGMFKDCFDIRDNTPNHRIKELEGRDFDEFLKDLSKDTHFFLCDGHFMNKLIICRGLPASGKTTWAKEWVMKDPEHRVRINLDDIRNMLGKYWVPAREHIVGTIQQEAVIVAMNFGVDIVLDNTNLNKKVVDAYVQVAEKFKYTVEYEDFFNVFLGECLRHNAIRNASLPKDMQLSDTVIVGMYERYKDVYNLKAN